MQKVLILGGKTGMLGQALMKKACEHGFEAFSLGREDCAQDYMTSDNSTKPRKVDFVSKAFLEKEISRINPDIIFNAIAYTAVDNAEDEIENAYHINHTLPQYLCEIIKGSSSHLVHFSTDFVFDGTKKSPYLETDKTKPLSVYGASKLAGEEALTSLPNVSILRTAWLFGLGRKNFVSTILKFAKERDTLRVVNDQVGSPTSTKDLAQMGFLIAHARLKGIYHAVNSGEASWCELAQKAISLSGLASTVEPITTNDWPQKATRPPYSVLSTQKLQKDLQYTPAHWHLALQEFLDEAVPYSTSS